MGNLQTSKQGSHGLWGLVPFQSWSRRPGRQRLPPFVCDAIKPVFETITNDSLPQKCAHGGSQNTNESFHNVILQRCPKSFFVGRARTTLAVEDSTIVYDGEVGRLGVFRELGMPAGFYTAQCFKDLDKRRITASFAQATPAARMSRRRAAYANAELNEGVEQFYQAGAHE